jgi:predicted house-cleaning noncanonical NTP pyrophosphatase (MazG superfamily)
LEPKLVRNKIPDHIADRGGVPICYGAAPQDFRQLLHDKLREEVAEYLDADDPAELADVMEVCYALAQFHGVNASRLDGMRQAKAITHGTFSEMIVWAGNQP